MLSSLLEAYSAIPIGMRVILPHLAIAISMLVVAIPVFSAVRSRPDLPSAYRSLGYMIFWGLVAVVIFEIAAAWLRWQATEGVLWVADLAALMVVALSVYAAARVLPRLLVLPSPRELELNNESLRAEVEAHVRTMDELNEARDRLESEVARRTSELSAINQHFRAALAGSDIAVFTQDKNLTFTWAYDPQEAQFPERIVGQTDDVMFPTLLAPDVIAAKRNVLETGVGTSINMALPTDEQVSRYLRLSIEPLRDEGGDIVGLTSAVVDLTERHDYETRLSALTTSLAEANARFDLALRGSTIMVFSHDADLRYSWVYNPTFRVPAEEFLGRRDDEIWSAEAVKPLIAIKEAALKAEGTQNADVSLTLDGVERFFRLRLEPIFDADRNTIGLAGVTVDVTEARQQEAHLRLVMRELTHRSKNLLAVIQAMARQTAARSDDPQTFVTRFSARLRAMAASHDLLVAHEWHGVVLHDLVQAQIAQAVDPGSEQVTIEGPMLSLKPDAVQNIGLALHELTTNASKYGALSVPDGRIAIAWSMGTDGRFRLRWQELNGPHVATPERTGFGVTLLERTVGQALDGTVTLSFDERGLVCDIDIPGSYALPPLAA